MYLKPGITPIKRQYLIYLLHIHRDVCLTRRL
jgi:hypothetical protein